MMSSRSSSPSHTRSTTGWGGSFSAYFSHLLSVSVGLVLGGLFWNSRQMTDNLAAMNVMTTLAPTTAENQNYHHEPWNEIENNNLGRPLGVLFVEPNASFRSDPSSFSSSIRNLDPGSTRTPMVARGGEWIGPMWIPPTPWIWLGRADLQRLYQHEHLWWMGDSTMRRAAMTFYALLNQTEASPALLPLPKNSSVFVGEPLNDDSTMNRKNDTAATPVRRTWQIHASLIDGPGIVDINRRRVTEHCTDWPLDHNDNQTTRWKPNQCRRFGYQPGANYNETVQPDGIFWYSNMTCLKFLDEFLRWEVEGLSAITAPVNLLILSGGVHDVLLPTNCRDQEAKRSTLQLLDSVLQRAQHLTQVRPNLTLVWRTNGYCDDRTPVEYARRSKLIRQLNQHAVQFIQARFPGNHGPLSYVDWGEAVYARSFGPQRLVGDVQAHYGLEPRLVMVQMLTNHLLDLGYFVARHQQNASSRLE